MGGRAGIRRSRGLQPDLDIRTVGVGNAVDPDGLFLDLMFAAEAAILNAASTDAQLLALEQQLAKVHQAY